MKIVKQKKNNIKRNDNPLFNNNEKSKNNKQKLINLTKHQKKDIESIRIEERNEIKGKEKINLRQEKPQNVYPGFPRSNFMFYDVIYKFILKKKLTKNPNSKFDKKILNANHTNNKDYNLL